ncbi:hypothetical protein SAMD00019534_024590 [Acytostelium subglobosum LB1]|uniref:hypothetical protein n=1 Tax=Acytostelium subglobosum LB1 TaxID=1410327 RepID=UPI000644F1C2|nr:hypothetical protein SAMD00019534_024590 [Acytostelium subglobosum LB1]GAM19284.1 hypothetical protein SAMD00019534_024590 [Acytostelium subglobosum LB1]|eukprot:XP_012757211.1 hypothetical protein SAMD00019534_024590 [Acytostelium subglobosum LB1]
MVKDFVRSLITPIDLLNAMPQLSKMYDRLPDNDPTRLRKLSKLTERFLYVTDQDHKLEDVWRLHQQSINVTKLSTLPNITITSCDLALAILRFAAFDIDSRSRTNTSYAFLLDREFVELLLSQSQAKQQQLQQQQQQSTMLLDQLALGYGLAQLRGALIDVINYFVPSSSSFSIHFYPATSNVFDMPNYSRQLIHKCFGKDRVQLVLEQWFLTSMDNIKGEYNSNTAALCMLHLVLIEDKTQDNLLANHKQIVFDFIISTCTHLEQHIKLLEQMDNSAHLDDLRDVLDVILDEAMDNDNQQRIIGLFTMSNDPRHLNILFNIFHQRIHRLKNFKPLFPTLTFTNKSRMIKAMGPSFQINHGRAWLYLME